MDWCLSLEYIDKCRIGGISLWSLNSTSRPLWTEPCSIGSLLFHSSFSLWISSFMKTPLISGTFYLYLRTSASSRSVHQNKISKITQRFRKTHHLQALPQRTSTTSVWTHWFFKEGRDCFCFSKKFATRNKWCK